MCRWVHFHKFATHYLGFCTQLLGKYQKNGAMMKKFDRHDRMVERKNSRGARTTTRKRPSPVGSTILPTRLLALPKKKKPYIGSERSMEPMPGRTDVQNPEMSELDMEITVSTQSTW